MYISTAYVLRNDEVGNERQEYNQTNVERETTSEEEWILFWERNDCVKERGCKNRSTTGVKDECEETSEEKQYYYIRKHLESDICNARAFDVRPSSRLFPSPFSFLIPHMVAFQSISLSVSEITAMKIF